MNTYRKTLSPELKLLALLSHPKLAHDQHQQVFALIRTVDESCFKIFVEKNRVWPNVYLNIRDYFPNNFSDEFIQYLEHAYERNVQLSQQQFSAYGELLYLFKQANIPVRPLKGIPLAKRLYSDIVKKHSHDIDLLIPPDYINLAHEVLRKSGYLCPEFDALSTFHRKRYFDVNKDITYKNRFGITLELHIRLCEYRSTLSSQGTEQLFTDQDTEKKYNNEIVYLCWHGAHTLYHRIKWLLDIALYLEQETSHPSFHPEQLLHQAKELDEVRSLTISWVLANTLYSTPLPQEIEHLYKNDLPSRIIVNRSINLLKNPSEISSVKHKLSIILFEFLLTKQWKTKYKILKNKTKPNQNDIKLLPFLPDKLFFLYYLIRPLRLFYKHLISRVKFKT